MPVLLILFVLQDQPSWEDLEKEFDPLRRELARIEELREPEKILNDAALLSLKVRAFLKKYPESPHTLEALELLSNAHSEMGRALLRLGKAGAAEGEFRRALEACADLVRRTRRADEENRDPDQQARLELQRLYAGYLHIATEFYIARALSEQNGRLEDLRKHVAQMEKHFLRYMFRFDTQHWALDAATYMGRACRLLAEALGSKYYTDAERAWEKTFKYLRKGRELMNDPYWREREEVRRICLRSTYQEILARKAYADLLKKVGVPYRRQYLRAIELAERVFTAYPDVADTPDGKRIREEVACLRERLEDR